MEPRSNGKKRNLLLTWVILAVVSIAIAGCFAASAHGAAHQKSVAAVNDAPRVASSIEAVSCTYTTNDQPERRGIEEASILMVIGSNDSLAGASAKDQTHQILAGRYDRVTGIAAAVDGSEKAPVLSEQ